MALVEVSNSHAEAKITQRLDDRFNTEDDEDRKYRRVQFAERESDVVHIPRNPKGTWYSQPEYRAFRTLWRFNQLQLERAKGIGFCLELFGWNNENMENFQSFPQETRVRREKLRNIIFRHQDECRSKGLYDPDGVSILSKSVSKHDQNRALKSAAANALEAEAYREEASSQPSSPNSVAHFLFGVALNDPIDCCSGAFNWQFDKEIMNYEQHYGDLSDGESSTSSSGSDDD
jgi:hypothetical protein